MLFMRVIFWSCLVIFFIDLLKILFRGHKFLINNKRMLYEAGIGDTKRLKPTGVEGGSERFCHRFFFPKYDFGFVYVQIGESKLAESSGLLVSKNWDSSPWSLNHMYICIYIYIYINTYTTRLPTCMFAFRHACLQ